MDSANLLQHCREFLSGKGNPDDLKRLLLQKGVEIRMIRSRFRQTVEGLPPEIRDICQEKIEEAERAFEGGQETLGYIEHALQGREPQTLAQPIDQMEAAFHEIDRALFEVRQSGLAALGPTAIPGINLIFQTVNRLKNGEAMHDLLKRQVEHEKAAIQRLLQDFQKQAPERAALREAYLLCLSGMNQVLEALEFSQSELLEKGLSDLVSSADKIHEIENSLEVRRLTSGPTASSSANLVVNLCREVREGKEGASRLQKAYQALQEDLNRIKFSHQIILNIPSEPEEVRKHKEEIGPLLAQYEEALAKLEAYFQEGDSWVLTSVPKKIEELTKELERFFKIFETMAEKETKLPCVRCGHYNPRSRRTCEQCSAVLLMPVERIGPLFSILGPDYADPLARFFESARQAASGQMNREEFVRELALLEEALQKAERKRRAAQDPSQAAEPEARKAADTYDEALQILAAGLGLLRGFASGWEMESLYAGLQALWQGAAKLQQAEAEAG